MGQGLSPTAITWLWDSSTPGSDWEDSVLFTWPQSSPLSTMLFLKWGVLVFFSFGSKHTTVHAGSECLSSLLVLLQTAKDPSTQSSSCLQTWTRLNDAFQRSFDSPCWTCLGQRPSSSADVRRTGKEPVWVEKAPFLYVEVLCWILRAHLLNPCGRCLATRIQVFSCRLNRKFSSTQ